MSASVRLSRSRTRARCSGRSVSRRRPLASCPWQADPGPSWSRPRVDDGRPAGTAARGSRESPSSLGMCDVPILWVPAGPQCCQHGRFPREGILCLPPPFQGPRHRAAPPGSRSARRLIHCCRNLVRYHYHVINYSGTSRRCNHN